MTSSIQKCILKFHSSVNSQTHQFFPHLLQQKGKNYDLNHKYNYNISTKTHGHSDQYTFSNTNEKRKHFNPKQAYWKTHIPGSSQTHAFLNK